MKKSREFLGWFNIMLWAGVALILINIVLTFNGMSPFEYLQ
jgi:hypothetical protein